MEKLTLETIKNAVSSHAAAFRCVTEYQPAGGRGDKIFPPTYKEGKYAKEDRLIEGETVPCVLLDSVQSQANRMELTLLEAWRDKRIELPVIETKFETENILKPVTVTSLDAPHRIADAIFRDSLIEEDGRKLMFRKSKKGRVLDYTDIRNATGLFGLCPMALVFGIWDSTGPRGGMGAKIQRAVVSEMIGIDVRPGNKTSSRVDPLQIQKNACNVLIRKSDDDQNPDWTLLEEKTDGKKKSAKDKKEAANKPSEVNHGNIVPTISEGGFTIEKALQTTVISLVSIRRLRFPLNGGSDSDPATDITARTLLASLGLLSAVLMREEGADLRSRCLLVPTQEFVWELLDQPGKDAKTFQLDGDAAVEIFNQALAQARKANLPWEGLISLTPHPNLIELVEKSQELAAQIGTEEGE